MHFFSRFLSCSCSAVVDVTSPLTPRRKLGKALKSSMKQVVVAVLDADGAYGWFKKIVAYIRLPVPEGEAKTAVVADK